MKTLIFSSMALVGLLLVGLQHQQLRQLRADNASLQQASLEASRLKADLEKSNGDETQDAQDIARLREENRDLLKLRGEINQLRDARAQFEKVSAENQRLQSQEHNSQKSAAKDNLSQPIVINFNALYDIGLDTPEAACQTFFWAVRERNTQALTRCVVPESKAEVASYSKNDFKDVLSLEIVARRELDADTVQLGITIRMSDASQSPIKYVMKLSRKDGEWRLDLKNPL